MKSLKKTNTELILHGSLIRAMLSIAVPVVINSLLQTFYNLTDTYWLGQIGKEPLAAINLVTLVQNIVLTVGGGVSVAGSTARAAAQRVGRAVRPKNPLPQSEVQPITTCGAARRVGRAVRPESPHPQTEGSPITMCDAARPAWGAVRLESPCPQPEALQS